MDEPPPLGTLPSIAVLTLSVVLTDAPFVKVPRFLHFTIDSDCILLNVKFEGELSMSVLRNRAISFRKVGSKTDEFSKVKFSHAMASLLRIFTAFLPPLQPRYCTIHSIKLFPIHFTVLHHRNSTFPFVGPN